MNVLRTVRCSLILFAAYVLLATPAAAQNRAGLSVGATAFNLYGDDIVARGDTEWGFYGGAFGETHVADFLALHLGVNYAQKGGQGLVGAGLLESEQVELDLNYIELPLLAEIMLPLGGMWDLMAYGGIAAGFNVYCKAALGGGDKESCKDTAVGGAKTEWGLPAGGGLFYSLANGEMVVFEARYTWGLNDAISNASIRNRGWYFLIRLVKPTG